MNSLKKHQKIQNLLKKTIPTEIKAEKDANRIRTNMLLTTVGGKICQALTKFHLLHLVIFE